MVLYFYATLYPVSLTKSRLLIVLCGRHFNELLLFLHPSQISWMCVPHLVRLVQVWHMLLFMWFMLTVLPQALWYIPAEALTDSLILG